MTLKNKKEKQDTTAYLKHKLAYPELRAEFSKPSCEWKTNRQTMKPIFPKRKTYIDHTK